MLNKVLAGVNFSVFTPQKIKVAEIIKYLICLILTHFKIKNSQVAKLTHGKIYSFRVCAVC